MSEDDLFIEAYLTETCWLTEGGNVCRTAHQADCVWMSPCSLADLLHWELYRWCGQHEDILREVLMRVRMYSIPHHRMKHQAFHCSHQHISRFLWSLISSVIYRTLIPHRRWLVIQPNLSAELYGVFLSSITKVIRSKIGNDSSFGKKKKKKNVNVTTCDQTSTGWMCCDILLASICFQA